MKIVNNKTLAPITIRPFDLEKDAAMLLDWVTNPHAEYWGMLDSNLEHLKKVYAELLATEAYNVCIGLVGDTPAFLMEYYNPITDVVGKHYNSKTGDVGMHVLVKAPTARIKGFTWHIFTGIMDFLFYDKNFQRIVVEPDVNNEKIHVLNKRAGFEYLDIIQLPNKTAHLATCTLRQYESAQAHLATLQTVDV